MIPDKLKLSTGGKLVSEDTAHERQITDQGRRFGRDICVLIRTVNPDCAVVDRGRSLTEDHDLSTIIHCRDDSIDTSDIATDLTSDSNLCVISKDLKSQSDA